MRLRGFSRRMSQRFVVVDNHVYEDKIYGGWFVPFQRKVDDYYRLLEQVPDDALVFTHMPLAESLPVGATLNQELVMQKDFDRFSEVYSGDIHRPGKFGKVVYVGTPSQRDWRDKNSSGAYGLLGSADGVYRSIPTYCPRHVEVEKAEDIPVDRQCIVKCPPDLDLGDAENIVSRVSSSRPKMEHFAVKETTANPNEDMANYVKSNPVKGVDNELLIESGAILFSGEVQ